MSRVLITGGAGFIGVHVTRALVLEGHEVRILDNLDARVHGPDARFPRGLPAGVECVRGDVRDAATVRDALCGVGSVIHLAALTSTSRSASHPRAYRAVNVVGTANVVRAALASAHAPRIVLGSSRAVYGEGSWRCSEHGGFRVRARRRDDLERGVYGVTCPRCGTEAEPLPVAEDHPTDPISVYGASKLSQERLCDAARRRGLRVVVLRYFNVYGSGQSLRDVDTGIVPELLRRITAGRTIELYEAGVPRRDFVHVADAVRATLAALAADGADDFVFNVGSGAAVPLAWVARELGAVLGRPARIELVQRHRPGDVAAVVADPRRAWARLGWRARTPLVEGLREFSHWASPAARAPDPERRATPTAPA